MGKEQTHQNSFMSEQSGCLRGTPCVTLEQRSRSHCDTACCRADREMQAQLVQKQAIMKAGGFVLVPFTLQKAA